jgi:xylan 1,4-beta-xylosidase
VTIEVDATQAGAPLERVWAFHGWDELNYTTVPEGKALLSTLVTMHTSAVHVRNHFLFNSGDGSPEVRWGSTNVYSEASTGEPSYDFGTTDQILDTITGAGAFPLVELGFMPETLSTHPAPYHNSGTTLLNGGCFYPPKDYAKWAELVRTWASHASDRYRAVAENWLWELWNEPDSAYWHGSFDDYAKLYDYTEAALHEVAPDAALGGPAVLDPAGDFLTRFLEHCKSGVNAVSGEAGARLDLVTFHAKGGVAEVEGHVEMNLGHQLGLHRAGFEAVATFPEFSGTPIYITEADPDGCAACSPDLVAGAAYRTSTAYGAYELAMMKRSLELEAETGVKLSGVLTWAFTFPDAPYFPGYRALATHGIELPVLSAFELLGRLSGARLPLTSSGARPLAELLAQSVRGPADVDGLATLDNGAIRVLVWNYHDDLVAAADTKVHLSIRVPATFGARAQLSHSRVDEAHGDAFSVWLEQGAPASPSVQQLADLRQAMDPASLTPDSTEPVAADGTLSVDFDLPRFGVSLVTLTPEGG